MLMFGVVCDWVLVSLILPFLQLVVVVLLK